MRFTVVVGIVLIGLATVSATPGAENPSAIGDEGGGTPSISSDGYNADRMLASETEGISLPGYRRAPPDLDRLSVELPAFQPLSASYEGGPDLRRDATRGTALASADFDEDGVPDLVSGYAATGGGIIALHRGNIDSIFPHTPEARQRRLAGTFTDEPFLSPALVFETPSSPDFIAAGDFDNDGHADVLTATRGDVQVYLLAGDGRGNLAAARSFGTEGAVTKMISGEINRRDGLPDVVLGVVAPEGPRVVIFQGPEGALRSEPQIIPMASEVGALALARLDADSFIDLVVGAGGSLQVIAGVAPADDAPGLEALADFVSPITSIAWGDFAWELTPQHELAVLTEDGFLHVLSGDNDWATIGERSVVSPGVGTSHLLPARLSGLLTEDLVIVGNDDRSIKSLAGMTRDESSGLATEGVMTSESMDNPVTSVLPMRLTPDALTDLVVFDEDASAPSFGTTAARATITVNTDADSTVAGDTFCTLREAIINANTDSDTTSGDCASGSGVDSIAFNIGGGASTATIASTSSLPEITDPVTIDGTTQGCASPPCIVLNGAGAGFVTAGLHLSAGSSTVRGLVIQQFIGDSGDPAVNAYGILLTSSGNFVEGNYCGTDVTGTVDQGNDGAGIRIEDGSNNTVGGTTVFARNVLSGSNGGRGINIVPNVGSADDNQVLGNYIGTDVTGTVDLGNAASGIGVLGANNTIGGTGAGARNIISGNGGNGIYMPEPAQGNQVLGNFIGTDVTGTVALGNGATYPGVWISGVNHTIGGTSTGARNIISGNPSHGVSLHDSGHHVLGNYIGTDVTGTIDLGNGTVGVRVEGQGNVVGGTTEGARNVISGNGSDGVFIAGATSTGNSVLGNFIGTDATGTADLGNTYVGVEADTGSSNTTIGGTSAGARNVISGNELGGVLFEDTSQNSVLGNYIGTDVTGTVALGNTGPGVWVLGGNNTIGGTSAGARNVISGNSQDGVYINGANAKLNEVVGNFIGTDFSGTIHVGNSFNGIEVIAASNNTIGGTSAAARNIISGNEMNGIMIANGSRISVLGNFIGTDVTGTSRVANGYDGVRVANSSNNTIGGTTAGAGNLVSGNGFYGVDLDVSTTCQVLGNSIGTDVTGSAGLGNSLAGVNIVNASSDNTIGGLTTESRNIIAYNLEEGVLVWSGTGNRLLGNSVFSNGLMGIDLGHSDGVTPNDPNDPDTGANNLQNFPVLTLASASPTPDVTLEGSLNSIPLTTYRVEFFANTVCDSFGCGEGERFLGATDLTTDGGGNVSFSVPLSAPVANGESIVATATDPGGSTSEYAVCFTATCSSLATFGQTIVAPDKDTLAWMVVTDVRFAKGDLADVSTYTTTGSGWIAAASTLDISGDSPGPGQGLYYLVESLGCGSWQSSPGAEPDRDIMLP